MSDSDERREQLQELVSRLGIRVNDFALLDQALTHASAVAEATGQGLHYESLEFLGDAALGLAVAQYLYRCVPGRSPGEYTKMRAGVVNRTILAGLAEGLDIGGAVRLGKGEEATGGRNRKALLADCLEAVIGVLYLDQGWDAAEAFVVRVFEDELKRVETTGDLWDYKSRLQQYCQARRLPLPEFVIVGEAGPDHAKVFEVEVMLDGESIGRGTGTTKKEAEQRAASVALKDRGERLANDAE